MRNTRRLMRARAIEKDNGPFLSKSRDKKHVSVDPVTTVRPCVALCGGGDGERSRRRSSSRDGRPYRPDTGDGGEEEEEEEEKIRKFQKKKPDALNKRACAGARATGSLSSGSLMTGVVRTLDPTT
ncbi:Hypothetical protein CINCED_3A020221 [Cinara cedri]|uniref:Uncharacterized protein n=1 Tax=Cinara cedri TaxID=506608 RepID=A0A5E4M2U7_9HEMI|nr:Hypothetical protein CINCED_3A020221 [Cinara cedri]